MAKAVSAKPANNLSADQLMFVSVADLPLSTKLAGMLKLLDLNYVGQVASQDQARFHGLFGYGKRTLEELESHLTQVGVQLGDAPEEWSHLGSADFKDQYRNEIRAARRAFAANAHGSSTLEEDFHHLLAAERKSRDKEIIAARYGWGGKPPATLQEVGNDQGAITRERVRQICSRFERRLTAKVHHLPSVARALKEIEDAVPAPDHLLSKRLVEIGLCTNRYSVEAIVNAADLGGLRVRVERANSPYSDYWVPKGKAGIPNEIAKLARQRTSSHGVTNLLQIADAVGQDFDLPLEPGAVEKILRSEEEFVLFDQDPGWFWIKTARNRLSNVLRKVFAVVERLHVSEVRNAVQRVRRLEGFAPPRRVLLAMAGLMPELSTDGEFIARRPGVAIDGWIEGTEVTFFEVLSRSGGVLDRVSLSRACAALGMNDITFGIYLGISPILQSLGRGVIALVGADYDEHVLKQYQRPSGSKAVTDFGWTPEGHIRIRYRITDHMLYTGFFPIPAEMSGYLASQQFEMRGQDGTSLGGLLKVKESQAWGLKRLFSSLGGELGDPFELRFGLDRKIVTVTFGELERRDDPTEAD